MFDKTRTHEANLKFMEATKRLLSNYTLTEIKVVEELQELYKDVEEAELVDQLISKLIRKYSPKEFMDQLRSKYPLFLCLNIATERFGYDPEVLRSLSSKQLLNILDNFELEV